MNRYPGVSAAQLASVPHRPGVPITLALHDDCEVTTRGLAEMLAGYSTWVSMIPEKRATELDVMLFDPQLGGRNRWERVGELLEDPRASRVCIYTWDLSPALMQRANQYGVQGYLSKEMGGRDLIDALVRIRRGDRVASRPAEQIGWSGRPEGLTVRESEVVCLIAQGLSNREIADISCLSINSVKSYIRSAYRKMNVTTRSQALLWAHKRGLLDQAPLSPHRSLAGASSSVAV